MNEFKAENAIFTCVLKDNGIIKELSLQPTHFYDSQNQMIYSAMQALSRKNEPIEPFSIMEQLGNNNFLRLGFDYFSSILKQPVQEHNYKYYEQQVYKYWKQRRVRDLIVPIAESGLQDVEMIQTLIKDLTNIGESGTQDTFKQHDLLKRMRDLVDKEQPKGFSGIPTGYSEIDLKIDGLQKKTSTIIAARPSMGKTAFVLAVANNLMKRDVIPAIFSLEMDEASLVKRMITSIAQLDGFRAKNPYHRFDDKEKEKWRTAIEFLETSTFYIYDKPAQTINEMRAKVRQIKNLHPGKEVVVLIDYLTLIKPNSQYNGNSHQQVTEISADLKSMAKEFDIPVVTLAQLSRSVEQRSDKRPMMSDIRESGSIEQDADVIMFLYRDSYYNKETEQQNTLEVNVAKCRDGEIGTALLYYDKSKNVIRNRGAN